MRANNHKAAGEYCLPEDNKSSSGSSSDLGHKVGDSIHQSALQRNFRRRRRRRRPRYLNSTSRLVVWTLIVTVISIPHRHCATQADSLQNSTLVSNAIIEQQTARRPEVRNDDSDVISASEILTNPFQPPARRRTSTNQTATSEASPVGEDKLDAAHPRSRQEDGQQFDIVSAADAAPPPPPSRDDTTLEQHHQETASQQTSRLLLQLLVLGLFILVSSALIIVYSIKFCVCQRRKERRLLRRALVGDVSAHTGNDLHQTAAYQHQHQHHHQQQQHLLLSLRHPTQLAQLDAQNLLDDNLHSYNHLLTTTDCACLQPTTTTPPLEDHHQLQVISCLVGGAQQHQAQLAPADSDPDVLHYFPSPANCQSQPVNPPQQSQLILALLNRLQQLLALAGHEQQSSSSSSSSAPPLGSPQQLSQLIVAQLQAQFSGPLLVGHGHQAACLCPHGASNLRTLPVAGPAQQPSSRPPAYSELFSAGATAASGNDARTVQVGPEQQQEQEEDDDDVRRRSARGRSRAPRAQSLQPPPLAPIAQ